MAYRALIPLKANGKEYAPGDVVPGASNFPNIKDLVTARYLEIVEDFSPEEVSNNDMELSKSNSKRKGRR